MIKNQLVSGPTLHPQPYKDVFVIIDLFVKDHLTQKVFMEDVMLYVVKGFLPLRTIESIWFQ
jgi:hypothetical protein